MFIYSLFIPRGGIVKTGGGMGSKKGEPHDKYNPLVLDWIISHFNKGGSIASLPAYLEKYHNLNITRDCIYKWAQRFPEFKARLERGKEMAQLNFEHLLMLDILGKSPKGSTKINSYSLQFVLKSRFHKTYSEKPENHDESLEDILDRVNSDK